MKNVVNGKWVKRYPFILILIKDGEWLIIFLGSNIACRMNLPSWASLLTYLLHLLNACITRPHLDKNSNTVYLSRSIIDVCMYATTSLVFSTTLLYIEDYFAQFRDIKKQYCAQQLLQVSPKHYEKQWKMISVNLFPFKLRILRIIIYVRFLIFSTQNLY